MVGDGDAVGIAAEILQDVLGSTEGWFGVDDPISAEEGAQPGSEELGMGEGCEFSGQVQLAVREGRLEAGDELATKHAPQHGDGEEEAWMGSNPAGVIAGESAGGNDAVHMRMKLELLVPGVQHAEEADLAPEMSGVASSFGPSPLPDTMPDADFCSAVRSPHVGSRRVATNCCPRPTSEDQNNEPRPYLRGSVRRASGFVVCWACSVTRR